jgi:excisionase family DNA binding protein
MATGEYLSTAQVAAALGVSVTTVKRWVDEGILPAHKTAGGHRKLLVADVLGLVKDGKFPRADLSLLNVAGLAVGRPDPSALAAEFFAALKSGDAEKLRALLHGAYRSGVSVESLADAVVASAQLRIGHEWETGRADILHEHRGSEMVAAALYELKGVIEANAKRNRPIAVGGAPEGDPYVLASLLAEMVLADSGWRAVNLGPRTPMSAFRRALTELRPRLVWLSVSHLEDPDRFLAEYREFFREAERAGASVAVGGRALTAGIRAGMPYTTFGDGLTHLASFARSLHPRPGRPRRGRPPRWATAGAEEPEGVEEESAV